jgi:hypothetical protein
VDWENQHLMDNQINLGVVLGSNLSVQILLENPSLKALNYTGAMNVLTAIEYQNQMAQ